MSSSGQWRVDPTGRYEYRWWDGDRYTEYVARYGEQLVDPAGVPGDIPPTIEVGFGSLERQNRWTVGFRLVLAIPHLIWITLVTLAALVVVVIGWFAALVTARLPDWAARFLHRVVQYHVRLFAYLSLMRDDYPPFALGNETYPVVVETRPGPLNRWAVLFRLVLGLPVLILADWLSAGLAFSMIVVWIIVLARGRMPGTLAQAIAAVVRFEARTYGYLMMLTSAYPSGLYGDPDPYGAAAEVALPAAETSPASPPRPARLVLGTGAKRLVTLFLVLGILNSVANNVLNLRVDERDGWVRSARVAGEPVRSAQ